MVTLVLDNGTNILRAIKVDGLTCFANSGYLLMKDLSCIWTGFFNKAEFLARFFKDCQSATSCCQEEPEKVRSHSWECHPASGAG